LYAFQYQNNPSAFEELMENMIKGLRLLPPAAVAPDDDIEMRVDIKFDLDRFAQAVRLSLTDLAG
jgi:hypothetical protein